MHNRQIRIIKNLVSAKPNINDGHCETVDNVVEKVYNIYCIDFMSKPKHHIADVSSEYSRHVGFLIVI